MPTEGISLLSLTEHGSGATPFLSYCRDTWSNGQGKVGPWGGGDFSGSWENLNSSTGWARAVLSVRSLSEIIGSFKRIGER